MRVPSVLLLGVASGLSVFGMAIIVPSMSSIATAFDADFAAVQFVVSAYLFGLALAQPVCGVLCDRLGRRPVMLTGFVVFTLASLLCAFAATLPLLIVSRFLQAVGVSVGTVATRAILRDTRDGDRMAEAMSYIAAAMGIAPIVAPIIGGSIDTLLGFRYAFFVTAAMGAFVFLTMRARLSETISRDHVPPDLATLGRNYRVLARSPRFVGYTLVYGFTQGAFFSFLAIGAAFFETAFGMGPRSFGMLWGLLAIAYVGGATLGARATPRIGAKAVLRISVWTLLAVGGSMLWVAHVDSPTPVIVLAPLALMMIVAGTGSPAAMAGAVRPHPEMAGTASGLSSAIALVIGGSFSILSGWLYRGDLVPAAGLIAFACTAIALSWVLANRPQRVSA